MPKSGEDKTVGTTSAASILGGVGPGTPRTQKAVEPEDVQEDRKRWEEENRFSNVRAVMYAGLNPALVVGGNPAPE
jgi:hypothetical protein